MMKKRKQHEKDRSTFWNGTIVVALVGAVAVFVAMLQMEKNMLTAYEKGVVYVAIKEIPEGLCITEANAGNYLEKKELDKSVISATAIKAPEQIQDIVSVYDIDEGTLLTTGMFEKLDEVKAEMEKPVIAGFRAEDMYQVVGGTLRTGDRINIYKIDAESDEALVWENRYVVQVFDNNGVEITSENATAAVQRINIYLESDETEQFYKELSKGLLRVVKVCD